MKALTILLVLAVSLPSAAPDDTVTEPGTSTKYSKTLGDNPTLKLMGVAYRSRYWVKVYGLALYADMVDFENHFNPKALSDSSLAEAVVKAPITCALILKFVRDVSRDSISGAFREGIERTIKINDPRIAADAKTFLDMMPNIKDRDVFELRFSPDGTVVGNRNGAELARVTNRTLAEAFLAIYIGPDPIDENIKRKLVQFR